MPDPGSEAIDVGAALHALALLLDDDAALPGLARIGLSVILAQLAQRLDALGGALQDQRLAA